MKQREQSIIKIVVYLAVILLPVVAMAQPNDPNDTTSSGVPIDGGLGILMGAGAVYVVRKMRKK
jgi:hypothetical protein